MGIIGNMSPIGEKMITPLPFIIEDKPMINAGAENVTPIIHTTITISGSSHSDPGKTPLNISSNIELYGDEKSIINEEKDSLYNAEKAVRKWERKERMARCKRRLFIDEAVKTAAIFPLIPLNNLNNTAYESLFVVYS